MKQLVSLANRVLFVVAFLLAGIGAWEKLANLFGRTLTFVARTPPSRFLEWAATVLLFVIALQLREIKHLGGATKG